MSIVLIIRVTSFVAAWEITATIMVTQLTLCDRPPVLGAIAGLIADHAAVRKRLRRIQLGPLPPPDRPVPRRRLM